LSRAKDRSFEFPNSAFLPGRNPQTGDLNQWEFAPKGDPPFAKTGFQKFRQDTLKGCFSG